MTNLQSAFSNKKALIPFITAGDPDLATTRQLLLALQDAGADLIEIGIPFSDPVAEGVVVQRANERALRGGCTIDRIFSMLCDVQPLLHIPLVCVTYINPIVVYGAEKFMQRCAESGIAGLIVPDLPFEEKGEILDICRAYHVALLSTLVPTSSERIHKIAADAEGFLYLVPASDAPTSADVPAFVSAIRDASSLPCAIDCTDASPQQICTMASFADGIILSNAIVQLVEEQGENCPQPVSDYIKSIKALLSL